MSTHSMSSRRKRAAARRNTQARRLEIPRPEIRPREQQPAEASQPVAQERPGTHRTAAPQTELGRYGEHAESKSAGASGLNGRRAMPMGAADAKYDPAYDGSRATFPDSARDELGSPLFPSAVPLRGRPISGGASFSWRERDWRSSGWLREARVLPGIVALLAIVGLASAFAFMLANRAASASQAGIGTAAATQPLQSGVLVQQAPAVLTPSPEVPPYQIGVWVDNPTPGAAGTEKVFVRVSHQVAPVLGAQVTLLVQSASGAQSYGPRPTGADGLVSFDVGYGYVPAGQPVFVTATTTEGGQTVTAQTTFFPG